MLRGKTEESEKSSSCWVSNPGHLACAASALPLSYDNHADNYQTHNPPSVREFLTLNAWIIFSGTSCTGLWELVVV